MRISDWSSDVCSSDLPEGAFVVQASRLASGAEQALADHRRIGVVRVRDHRRRTDGIGAVVAMAELLAGTRAIALLLEMLPDEIGAKAAARLETDGQAGLPEIAAVDPVLRHRIIIIARPLRSEEHTSEIQSLMR